MIKYIIILTLIFSPVMASAVQDSTALTLDKRVKRYIYVPNEVFVFTGHYRYQSTIVLDPNEKIQSILLGDSVGWLIENSENRIFLKPIEADVITNMTVLTDKRTYLFELHAEYADDIRDNSLSFIAKFEYNDNVEGDGVGASFMSFDRPSIKKKSDVPEFDDPDKLLNFNYTITGSRLVAPLKIFDDGEFTYMEFRQINADLPAIYRVDKYGNEELVNYRVSDQYLVVERVTSQFTLRHGNDITCVFNEARPLEKKKEKKKFLGFF